VVLLFLAVKSCSKALFAYVWGHGKTPCFLRRVVFALVDVIRQVQISRLLMLRKYWSEHFSMENCENPVQNNKKKCSRSNKVGRLKYNQQLLKKAQKDIEEIKLMQRTIWVGLKGFVSKTA
jgi:hypothetical protein